VEDRAVCRVVGSARCQQTPKQTETNKILILVYRFDFKTEWNS